MIIIQFDTKRKYYVYEWFFKETGKIFYVGKGCKYRYRSRKRANKKFAEIINSNECDSRIIKNNLNEEEAFEFEKIVIEQYRKAGQPLINIQDGGYKPPSAKGVIRSEQTRCKLSKSIKHYYDTHSEDKILRSNNMKAFLETKEGKEFQKKSIETRRTEKFRKKQSEICKAANNTKEYKLRQSEIAKKTWKSDEYRKLHSGSNNSRAQAVRQYDLERNFIAEYPTMTDAYKNTGVSVAKISLVAKKQRKTAGGFIWEYVDEKKIAQKKNSYVYDVEKDKNAKPIIQYTINGDFVREYRSIAEATTINSFKNRTNIIQNLKGKTKHAYGYVWRYKQDNIVPSLPK